MTTVTTRGRDAIDQPCVLIVEDDNAVCGMIREALARTGWHAVAVGSPTEAEAAVADIHLDLLITDMVLPGGTGLELAGKLRRGRPALPVVYVTGWIDHSALEDVGGGTVLFKPFALPDLARAVAGALGAET